MTFCHAPNEFKQDENILQAISCKMLLIVFTYIFTRLILFELEFSELIGDYRWYQSKKNTVPEPVKATITPVASPFFLT